MTTSTVLSTASQPTQLKIFPECLSLNPGAKREKTNSHICCQPLIPLFENMTCNVSIANADEAETRCSNFTQPNFDVREHCSIKTTNGSDPDSAKCSHDYDVLNCYESNINASCGSLARDLFMMQILIFNNPSVYNDSLEPACLKLINYFGQHTIPGHPDSSSTETTLKECPENHLCFKEDRMHACCRPLLSVFKDYEYDNKNTIKMVQERCGLYGNATDCKLHCSWWSMICKDVSEFVHAAKCVKRITNITTTTPETCPTESSTENSCEVASNWVKCIEKTVIDTCGDLGRDIVMHAALKQDFKDDHMGYYSTLYPIFSGKIFESSDVRCLLLLDEMAHHRTFQNYNDQEDGHTDDYTEAPHTDVTISLAVKIKISTSLMINTLILAYKMKHDVDFV
ncbi:hypothetical protein Ddc_17679 [Ditylenchus destructor]|nr:hypothetical protein Ddc_17679 [Ditylenchus destructor]